MLKNLLRVPNTFEREDRRRRQVLNVLLISLLLVNLLGSIIILIYMFSNILERSKTLLLLSGLVFIFLSTLWLMNRSDRIPSWVNGTVFIILVICLFSQADTPNELYNGRSTIVWAAPIMLGALLFQTGYQFLITLLICSMMQFLTPPDSRYPGHSVNYFSMIDLLFITLISWLGQRISQQASDDARKQAENASRQAANLEAVLNSIADGVLVLDLNGKFISANPALLKMLPEEQLMEIIAKPLEKNLRWQRKLFTVNTSLVPEVGSVAVFRDETRRHEIDRAKDALLATASHELRTPLTAIMNYLEMIQTFIRMDKISMTEFDGYMERAIENTHRLHQLINNILDQAQIQAGALELKEKIFNLPILLEKNRQLLDTLLKQKGLSYSLNIDSNVPNEINGDPDRLYQVLLNLVGNAIKFTKQGGVQVKVFLQNKSNLAIEVADSGAGIADERLPDIFEAFRRGSDYAQREQQGAGLGLSITKEIVSRMGGDISVMSTLGAGSTFTVLIPIQVA
jgi:signal transduction histidine kinase